MNTIREKIKKNQPLACAFLRMPEPSSAEIMAVNGIDLIVIDWEHYQHNSETMVNIVRAADAYGTAQRMGWSGACWRTSIWRSWR